MLERAFLREIPVRSDSNENAVNHIKSEYSRLMGRKIAFLIILLILGIALVGVAAAIGFMDLSVFEVYSAILCRFAPQYFQADQEAMIVVWNIRLSRIILGVFAGMGLGISGAVMQSVLKNPLASPFTLGIASASGFGAAVAIILGQGFFGNYLVAGNAFVFALGSSMLILGIAKHKGTTPEIMVLSGISIMYFFSACTTLLEYFATPDAVKEAMFWAVGSLARSSWDKLTVLFIVLCICIPVLVWRSWDLDVIGSGDETAKSLGVDVDRIRNRSMMISCLIVGSVVAITGTIGFIGLVSPHITRMIIGGDSRFVLPGSALIGGLLLAGADIASQHIIPPVILPVGAVTAFLGIPLFFYLILRGRQGYWQ